MTSWSASKYNITYIPIHLNVIDSAGSSSVANGGPPLSKRPRKRLGVNVIAPTFNFQWVSDFNLDGKVTRSEEIGDGATSKVYTDIIMVRE